MDRRRLAFIAAVLVLIVATGAIVTLSSKAPAEKAPVAQPCQPDSCSLSGDTAEQALAARYSPILYLQDRVTDCKLRNGDFRPRPVELFLTNPQVGLRSKGSADVTQGPTAQDVAGMGRDYYLDLPGDPRRPECRYLEDGRAVAARAQLPDVTYARVVTEPGFENELVLQYWFFYYFNQWNNKHEGDWEMMQLVFEAATPQAALSQSPVRVAYSQHSNGELALWDDEKLEKEGDHPISHVAAGSHSNRYGPHVYIGRAEGGAGFGCDDAAGTTRVLPEPRLMPDAVPSADDPYAWLTFEGRWGQFAGPQFDGPTGPNMKTQWHQPLTWENKLRYASVRVPVSDTAGPSAVQAFCNVVASGSNLLLPFYLKAPLVTMLALAMVAIVTVGSLTRTRYLPALPEPLAIPRRLGQIFVSSLGIYRRDFGLFIGIGLLYLPAGLLVTGVHWLLLSVSPVETIVPVPRSNILQNAATALVLAELPFGIAYSVVVAATTAALDDLNDGIVPSVRRSYLRLWRQLWQLVAPRLIATGVAIVLVLTIVGIPLAIRQAVRWRFLEQSILFENTRGRAAFEASSRTSRVDWWWAAGSTFLISLVGLFAAPAVGVILIFTTRSIPLADINLISSVIHIVLVPYAGIALALTFFNLKVRLGERHSETD